MSIEMDAWTFRRLTDVIMPGEVPSPSETRTILQIAQLAAGVDLDDDEAERGLLGAFTRHLCALGGILRSDVPVVSPLPIDAEERRAWIGALASQLPTPRGRDLAFAVAYLLIASDLELAPVEAELLEGLRSAFLIDADRAAELLLWVSELVTPGARSELESEHAHP